MPFFADQFVERVRAASDIVDVIGAVLPLKRAGGSFVTLCPFHKEKSPSFNVTPHKQIFHCFGCHKGGDVFRFVQDYENVSFPEAVERLAERARIPVEYEGGRGPSEGQRSSKDALLKIHEALCVRWQHCLANEAAGAAARDYIARRGIPDAAVQQFRLGAAPDAWDDTVNWARSKGFDAGLVEQAGLIIRGERGFYDRFRGRLMFPIMDEQGRVIAFSGRVISGDEKTAKYVNSPETPLFTKGRVLFAMDKAKRAILDAGFAVICEGQLDTIACHLAGIQNVVAPQGTALTSEHCRTLKRYVNEVVLCFDGDRAGQKAAVRSLDDLLASGLAIRVASIPPPDDPDSYIRRFGPEALRKVLAEARGFFDFYLQILREEHDLTTDRGRHAVVQAMGDAASKAGSELVMEDCARKCAGLLGISPLTALKQFRSMLARSKSAAAEPGAPGDRLDDEADAGGGFVRPSTMEMWFLKFVLLADGDPLAWLAAHLDPNWISHAGVRRIVELRLASAGAEHAGPLNALLDELEDDPPLRALATEAASERRAVPDLANQVQAAARRIRDAWLDRQIGVYSAKLDDVGLPEDQRVDALRRQQELRAWKRRPLEPLEGA